MIRDATPADISAITAIYNHAVLHTTAVWNDAPATEIQRLQWLRDRQEAGLPVIVAVVDGVVAGYASYGPFRPFAGYKDTVEHSVYVDPAMHRRGLGRLLLEAIIDRARANGLHVMVGGIAADNEGSIKLHERLGFVQTGLMPQVGQKFGKWLDLAMLQLTLDDRPAP